MEKVEKPNPEARLKARVDLWIHNNNLLWSRLQTLYFVQAAYFAICAYLIQSHDPRPVKETLGLTALGFAIVFQVLLVGLAVNERKDRNIHGKLIWEEFGFDVSEYSQRGQMRKWGFAGIYHKVDWTLRLGLLIGIYVLCTAMDIVGYFFVTSHVAP